MELNSVFGGDHLKAVDLQGREHLVVIESVTVKKFDNGNKLVITFQGRKKSLVANKTNSNRIALGYGTNTDLWVGKEIILYPDIVDFQGAAHEAIRVRPAPRRTDPQVPPRQPTSTVSVAAGQVVQERDGYTVSTGTDRQRRDDGNVGSGHPNAPGVDLEDTF